MTSTTVWIILCTLFILLLGAQVYFVHKDINEKIAGAKRRFREAREKRELESKKRIIESKKESGGLTMKQKVELAEELHKIAKERYLTQSTFDSTGKHIDLSDPKKYGTEVGVFKQGFEIHLRDIPGFDPNSTPREFMQIVSLEFPNTICQRVADYKDMYPDSDLNGEVWEVRIGGSSGHPKNLLFLFPFS